MECYCLGIEVDSNSLDAGYKWKNAKCDVQALWSHIQYCREIFVTSDKNFHLQSKKISLIKLFNGKIETPESAVKLLRSG